MQWDRNGTLSGYGRTTDLSVIRYIVHDNRVDNGTTMSRLTPKSITGI